MAANYSNKYQHKSSFAKVFFVGFLIVMIATTLYFSNFLINQYQSLSAGASSGTAELFFEPSSLVTPPDSSVGLWVTTDKPLGFASVEINFDNTKLKLTQELTFPTVQFKKMIKQTSMTEANNTGKIAFVIAVDQTTLSSAPSGNFTLASLKFAPKTTLSNQQAALSITTTKVQLVDQGAIPFTVTGKNATFTINPVASTPSPSATAQPSKTPDPTSTLAPSIKPSVAPTVVPSAVPSSKDLIAPSIKITSGRGWNGYWIKVEATDDSDIATISMMKDNSVVKTCNGKNKCTYKPGWISRPYDVQVSVTDNSITHNSAFGSIVIR